MRGSLRGGRVVTLGVVVVLGAALTACQPESTTSQEDRADPVSLTDSLAASLSADLGDAELALLAEAVAAAMLQDTATLAGLEPVGALAENLGAAYAVLRSGGQAQAWAWADGDTALEAVLAAVDQALSGEATQDAAEAVDTVEVVLTHSYRDVDLSDGIPGALSNSHRGIRGLQLVHGGEPHWISPTWMIATNRAFERALELYARDRALSERQFLDDVQVRRFEAEQALVFLEDPPFARRMVRGNTYVPVEDVTRETTAQLAEELGDWLVRAVHTDGRMTYKYWPSSGQESAANNMIRQWMATTALGRFAATRDDEGVWELTRRNIAYNLEQFYEEEDDLGLIVEDEVKVKLGAVALAARALVEHPDRDQYGDAEAALRRMVDHLWREDGSFKTWYRPADQTGQENFYPGEALYLWSALLADEVEADLLQRFMQSFRYYRDWHLDPDNRNPAFVPWHTQAYYEVWRETADPELAAFIFEMNDWLLGMQQWDDVVYPDMAGRFYDPDRSHFGPPHASSTGVYLEGLIDAYRLAVALGEDERAEAYRTAIVRGLRSVMQLVFTDEIDMYYITQRDRVRGGVRTTEYNNEIRVDNVQHNLMAVLKILETFTADDFLAR